MLWRKKKKRKSRQLFFRMHFSSVLHIPRTMVTSPSASGHLMCWDHLVSCSRCSCWCLSSCVFFHRNISHGWVPPRLVHRRAAWLSVKKRKTLFYHPQKCCWCLNTCSWYERCILKKRLVWVWCVWVCACVARKRANVRGCREKSGLCLVCVLVGLCIAEDFFSFRVAPTWPPLDFCPSLVWVPESLAGRLFRKLLPPFSFVLVFRADGPEEAPGQKFTKKSIYAGEFFCPHSVDRCA